MQQRGNGIPELENRVKPNCDVIALFSLIFRDSEFLMKITFPSYEILSLFNNTKIPELHISGI